jgi:hypothetical protein
MPGRGIGLLERRMEVVGSSTIGDLTNGGHGTGAFHLLSLISTDLHLAT